MNTPIQSALCFDDQAALSQAPSAAHQVPENEVERAYAIGRLLIEVDEPRKAGTCNTYYVGHERIANHEDIRLVHVISKTQGGEVHGYVIARDRLRLRGPAYAGAWAELDALVSRVTGAQLEPYVMGTNGMPSMPRGA